MRFLRTLGVGDRFRPAHPRQTSLNKRKMERTTTYKVTKVYPMSPHTTVAVHDKKPDDGFYSLGPGTPVLLPREISPSEDEVMRFIGVKKKHRLVGYRVLWDGKLPLQGIIPPQAIAAMKLMFSLGKVEYTVTEINVLFNEYYEKFWGRPVKRDPCQILQFYRRYLVNHCLIEEIVDNSPIPGGVSDANLQEAYYE